MRRVGLVRSLGLVFVCIAQVAGAAVPPESAPEAKTASGLRSGAATKPAAEAKRTTQAKGKAKANPKAKPLNPAVEIVTSRMIEIVTKNPQALDASRAPRAMDLVLRARSVTSAEKLLGVVSLGSDDLRSAGHLCAMLPGGAGGPRGRKLLAHQGAKAGQVGTLEGLAIGYARAGKTKQALAEVRELSEPAWERTLLAELMTIRPAQPFIDAFLKTERLSISGHHAGPLLRAYLILGQDGAADELVRELRAAAAAKQGDPAAKSRISLLTPDDADPLIFRAVFFARLAKGDVGHAMTLEKERFAKAMAAAAGAKERDDAEFRAQARRLEAYHAIVAALSLKGELAAARAAAGEAKGIHGADALDVPVTYALAKTGDAAAVDAFLAGLSELEKRSPNLHAAAFGAASAGRFAAGDPDGAKRYAREAVSRVGLMTEDRHQADALLHLLAGIVLGPEAVLFTDHSREAYPLRVPSS